MVAMDGYLIAMINTHIWKSIEEVYFLSADLRCGGAGDLGQLGIEYRSLLRKTTGIHGIISR